MSLNAKHEIHREQAVFSVLVLAFFAGCILETSIIPPLLLLSYSHSAKRSYISPVLHNSNNIICDSSAAIKAIETTDYSSKLVASTKEALSKSSKQRLSVHHSLD